MEFRHAHLPHSWLQGSLKETQSIEELKCLPTVTRTCGEVEGAAVHADALFAAHFLVDQHSI